MGLRSVIQNAVQAGFRALGDIPQSGTLRRFQSVTYDAQSGQSAQKWADTAISGVAWDFEDREIDGDQIRIGDQKLIYSYSDYPVLPTTKDLYIDSAGEVWRVAPWMQDPVQATVTLHMRRTSSPGPWYGDKSYG